MRGDEGIAPYKGVYKQHAKLQFTQQFIYTDRS